MKAGRILLHLLCLNVVTFGVIAGPQTCPASDLESGCSDSEEWKGEFFPGIPKIKYE
ncbi:PREDICTED: xylose isomerase, partial [Prunus dulcis]